MHQHGLNLVTRLSIKNDQTGAETEMHKYVLVINGASSGVQLKKSIMQKVDSNDFSIMVSYSKRSYRYKVIHERVSHQQEIFKIVGDRKTVIVESNWRLLPRQGLRISKRLYKYDENEITNKKLMKRIISSIDNYMSSSVSEIKTKTAIAI